MVAVGPGPRLHVRLLPRTLYLAELKSILPLEYKRSPGVSISLSRRAGAAVVIAERPLHKASPGGSCSSLFTDTMTLSSTPGQGCGKLLKIQAGEIKHLQKNNLMQPFKVSTAMGASFPFFQVMVKI